jgi:hypothetical protein
MKRRRLFFKPEMAEKILAGIKTETRRRIRRPYTWFRPGDTFAVGSESFRITAIDRQRLGDMTEEDIRREGLNGRSEFVDLWARFYGNHDSEEEVLVLRFEPAREFFE